ncbi:hypothetical protein [Cupriavidus basilensis]
MPELPSPRSSDGAWRSGRALIYSPGAQRRWVHEYSASRCQPTAHRRQADRSLTTQFKIVDSALRLLPKLFQQIEIAHGDKVTSDALQQPFRSRLVLMGKVGDNVNGIALSRLGRVTGRRCPVASGQAYVCAISCRFDDLK